MDMTQNYSIGERITQAREQRDISIEELAKRAGCCG